MYNTPLNLMNILEEIKFTAKITIFLPTMIALFLQIFDIESMRLSLFYWMPFPFWLGIYLLFRKKENNLSLNNKKDINRNITINYIALAVIVFLISLYAKQEWIEYVAGNTILSGIHTVLLFLSAIILIFLPIVIFLSLLFPEEEN